MYCRHNSIVTRTVSFRKSSLPTLPALESHDHLQNLCMHNCAVGKGRAQAKKEKLGQVLGKRFECTVWWEDSRGVFSRPRTGVQPLFRQQNDDDGKKSDFQSI